MDFYVLSLPEASSLYLGLALQAMLRTSSLSHAPAMLILGGTVVLLWRNAGTSAPFKAAVSYLVVSAVLCILFWSEIVPWGHGLTRPLSSDQVASYAASQDPDADMVTATDTGEIPQHLQDAAWETPGFRLLLRVATEMPLAFARALNSQTHRTFAPIVSMQWLLGMELTTDINRALADFTEGCLKPSIAIDTEFSNAITAQELLPWGDTPVRRALATREVLPGAQTGRGYFRRDNTPLGLLFLQGSTPTATVRCDVYLDAVELETQRWLYAQKSPAGTPLLEVFAEDLHLDPQAQARFLIYQSLLKAMGGPAPAPSLAGAYGALSLGNAALGGASGFLSGIGTLLGGGTGAAKGAGSAVLTQAQQSVQWLLWWVALAAWLVFWAPYMLGVLLLVCVGLFPLAFLWALVPGAQFRPLVQYALILLWICSSPLWFALADLAARAAASQAPQTLDPILATLNWAPAQAYAVMVTVIGILLIPVMMLSLIFVSFRAVGGLWRGAAA